MKKVKTMDDTKTRKTRNSEVLKSFVEYCEAHPSERFWQCLLNWSGLPYICWSSFPLGGENGGDTFYWEGRIHDKP